MCDTCQVWDQWVKGIRYTTLFRQYVCSLCKSTRLQCLHMGMWVAFLTPVIVQAQEVVVSAEVDSTDILLGDQIDLTLSASWEPGAKINWPVILDSLGGMEVISVSDLDSTQSGNKIQGVQQYTLTAFDSGVYQIPPILFSYTGDYSNDTFTTQTQSLEIIVHTIPVDTTQAIKPIKDLQSAPITFNELLPWIVVGMIALLIIGGVVYVVFFRKKKPQIIPEKKAPVIPAHEIAFKKLHELEQKKLWQEGDVKTYYVELTDILREYLEGRFHIPALESTTIEIMNALHRKEIEEKQKRQLRELLERADLAKFAKMRPGPEHNRSDMELARNFVKETKAVQLDPDMLEQHPQNVASPNV